MSPVVWLLRRASTLGKCEEDISSREINILRQKQDEQVGEKQRTLVSIDYHSSSCIRQYSLDIIMNAAGFGSLLPEQQTQVIKKFFPHGALDVDCMDLQCIGFNSTLYQALLRSALGQNTKLMILDRKHWEWMPNVDVPI
jgi:hypothetical protein